MSGSGEQRPRRVEDEESDDEEIVEASGSGFPRAQTKTPRRSVQTKLNFFMSPKGGGRGRGGGTEEGEGESSSSGDEGRRQPKRKKKAQSRTPTKLPVICKEAIGFDSRSKKLLPTFGDGSDFFLKVSEKKLKQKHQREQEDMVDLTVEDDTCSKALGAVGKNYLLSSDSKGSKSKSWIRTGKSSAASDPGALDLNKYQPTMNPCSESKNTEEGNVHTSATRSVHPFFSHWKTTKPVSEISHVAKVSKNYCSALDDDVFISSPPIHVFETLQDNAISLDWGHWKIFGRSSLELPNSTDAPESNLLSVSDVLITPLKFDATIPFFNPSGDALPDEELHLVQFPGATNQFTGSNGTMAFRTGMQETHNQLASHIKKFQGPKEYTLSSRCTASLGNLENEQQCGPSQESLSLYQLHRDCWTECSLWTNKYQPDKAVEVCGNTESVRFLCEWLKSWQERQLLMTKNSTRSNGDLNEDSDDSLYQNDSDSENEDVAPLQNVLLITGPVGCGKSAAIYACAKEQGFQVIEVNASDERNGTHIKQKFGEAMDSHAIELCSIEDVDSSRKQGGLFMMGSSVSTVARELKNGDLKEASRLGKARRNEFPANAVENQISTCRVANKNLFLFEDVDAVFDEDRGFITTIMQLAETSRRPIILTTNSKNPILPQALSKLVVDFMRPSTEELLVHMRMVCAAEGAQASPWLVERLIRSCQGDIRKMFLLLQFWCQGQRGQQDKNIQCTYSPLPFDLDAAHWVITKVIPWAIPCELSLKVEEEITKAMSKAENQVILHQLKEEDDMIEPNDTPHISKDGIGASPAKKEAVMTTQRPSFQHGEFLSPSKEDGDFYDDSGSPLTFTRRRLKHRTDTVLSSQSGDVLAADTTIHIGSPTANSTLSPDACDMQSSQPIDHSNCLNPFDEPFGEHTNLSRDPFMTAEIVSTSHVCDSYMSRCMHESSLVPETEISNRNDSLSTTSSHFSASLHDFLISNIGSMQALSQEEIDNVNGTIVATHKDPFEFAKIHEIYTESVHGTEELGLSQKEVGVDLSRGYQLMDECSRADFGIEFMSVNSFKCHTVVGSVEETWRKLRSCHEDLKSYVTPGQKDAMKILDLTSGLTDLISEADILLRSCLSLTSDFLEPSAISFDEPCSNSWCDQHLVIASTFAQHGLCFYASKATTKPSNLGNEVPVYLAQEMLAASTSSLALGKLLLQKKTAINNLCTERGFQMESSKCEIPLGRELESMLCDAVHPIIPPRLHMVLKGPAFQEYVSFLSCMSKSENSRLSENKDQFQRRHRRVRASRHYLTSLQLSPEDVALLAGCSCFGQVGCR